MSSSRHEDPFVESSQRPPRSLAEWVSFAIASVVLLLVAGLVVYAGLTKDDQPPVLQVDRTGAVRQVKGKYYVPFEVTNQGGETAESVQVIAELAIDSEVKETGDFTIDFLSKNEKEEGAFVFERDPRQGELTIRVSSYQLP